jgi:carbon starvation protein
MIYSGSISTIWPMFGVANQLLAAIALGVGTTIILKSKKNKYALLTFVPMLFMFVMTLTASWQLAVMFMDKFKEMIATPEALALKIDIFLVVFMALLAIIVLLHMLHRWYGIIFRKHGTAKV